MSLNPAQSAAVETANGPLLVLAGAGTGKTRVVTFRIARLIKRGILPHRILAVTFTNKAAREMQERITDLLGSPKKDKSGKKSVPEISTFHSLCVRILRRNIHHLGYPNQFAIYDRGDQESIARSVLREIRVSDAALKPGDLLWKISQWKCAAIRPEQAASDAWNAKDHLAALAYSRYQTSLKTLGAVDFDDLLLCTEDLFAGFPTVLAEEANRFDHLLVDEYQDTNMSQYRIVKGLAQQHRNLCVVGDDDQAIYGWRGAEVTHILNFRKDWPDAKVVRLEMNYRSTSQIIDWANRIILFNKQRHPKQLQCTISGEVPRILQCKDGEIEAKTVVQQIKSRIVETKRQPRDFAILFRTNEQPRAFEMELRQANLPYVLVGGQSFFDKKEVRDILAYLKVAARPQDQVSLLRIMNTPPRGIGQTTIQKLTESAVSQNKSIWEVISRNDPVLETFTNKTRESIAQFKQLIDRISQMFRTEFSVAHLKELLDSIAYQNEINRLYQDPGERQSRWDSVGEVVNAAASYLQNVGESGGQNSWDSSDSRDNGDKRDNQESRDNTPDSGILMKPSRSRVGSLVGFLDNTSLAGPDFSSDNKKDLAKNAVALLTLHAAKGLEFKEVYMVGLEEGTLPHHRSINTDDALAVDEERRLCYVGITRAQRRLTLTLALSRMKWGKMRPTIPSRFLYEITGQAENPNYQKAIKGGK
ncbi:MAG: ATP-dependent helicase [Thermoguttaceae bacterium]